MTEKDKVDMCNRYLNELGYNHAEKLSKSIDLLNEVKKGVPIVNKLITLWDPTDEHINKIVKIGIHKNGQAMVKALYLSTPPDVISLDEDNYEITRLVHKKIRVRMREATRALLWALFLAVDAEYEKQLLNLMRDLSYF